MHRLTLRPLLCTFALSLIIPAPAFAAPGDIDPLNLNIVGSAVYTTAVQPDGKTIIAGDFSTMLGVPRQNIARLNADGTLDMGFDPKPNVGVNCIAVQVDGKVLLGGAFTTLQPNGAAFATARQRIARVNADGTLDTGFDPKADSYVFSLAIQPDGKVLLGGAFTTLQPNGAAAATVRQHIARVNADGTLDTGFDPKPNTLVNSVAVQADGKIILGGYFTTLQPNGAVSPTARQFIARVHANGTLETGFDPKPGGSFPSVKCVAVQADGKVLLGGDFTTLRPNGAASPTARNNIARVNPDGTLDMGFDPNATAIVYEVAVQTDGKVLLGGDFLTLRPNGAASSSFRRRIGRVNADGTLDTVFDPNAGNDVYSVGLQADGKVLLGGIFNSLTPNGAAFAERNKFARLTNDPATQNLSTPNAAQVLWQRGGAGPEFSRATFELSTDGGASWSPLGSGSRIGTTANWQLTGLALPSSGQLRARGATTAGWFNGSSGLIEQVTGFGADPDGDGLLDSWELTYWPTTAGHSAHNDFDYDGLTELVELAFGLNPTLPDSALQPAVVAEGGYLSITLTKHPGATYEVQSAGTLLSGQPASFSPATTTVLIDTATTLKVRDNILIGTPPARFMRVKVTAAP